MKFTKILTKKITSFWLLSLSGVAFVFLLCAVMSFIQLAYQFQQNKISELESMVLKHYQHQGVRNLEAWLPSVLTAYHVDQYSLSVDNKILFSFQAPQPSESNLRHYQRVIEPQSGLTMTMDVQSFYLQHRLGWYELIILFIGLLAIGIFVRLSLSWLANELAGIEQLAERSQLILEGDLSSAKQAVGKGRPRMINRALSRLLDDLEDAKQERSRLDQFIRANTFLDPVTQIGNHLYFENRIDALTHDNKMIAYGVIFLLEFDNDALLYEPTDIEANKVYLTQIVEVITPLIAEINDVIFARRTPSQLVIVAPQLSLAEADILASRILKNCLVLEHRQIVNHDNYLHLGAAFYKAEDAQLQIIEEAEMALRAAQLQRFNTWFMYDKGAVDKEIAKGSVRWRSFLEYALVNKRFFVLTQPVFDSDNTQLHYEVFSRVRDNQDNEIRATLFIPMANKCGLMPQIERQVLERVLFELMPNNELTYSINLTLDSLTSRAFTRWIRTSLLEHRKLAERLVFEVSEEVFIKREHDEQVRKTLVMLSGMGAKLSVDHVGKQVVGTHYIQSFEFDYVKLDRSIVRQVHQRPENQLYIRSLIGGIFRTKAQVMAEGIELLEEWQTLKILGVSAGQGPFLGDTLIV
ncbi:RNase E specificity factor CsrD [Shewanella aestuarii]|uniref:RNase E specificity factor CsrD n=1 Tax=Shewanella aestuarii TaxID=1028752 RepID=A0A6G9QH15_9GAMM|nr:RNase E specificity factor CsrD [Shewanella aestuarii]QIR13357.1 RNase E specificity factor CsrD [Shewanella aestuarii]